MNIFVLDSNPILAAMYQVDKHVVKMPLETAQLLCTAHHGYNQVPYTVTHYNHPCAKWVRESLSNYMWLVKHGFALGNEYKYRYGKEHKSIEVIRNLPMPKHLEDKGPSSFPLAMPDECKTSDPVESYRNYYMQHKRTLATWRFRNQPEWWK